MNFTQPADANELEGLERTERQLRDALTSDPVDNGVRMRLAWCLFVKSVFLTGRQNEGGKAPDEELSLMDLRGECQPSAIIDEAVRHTNVVLQLSRDAELRREVELLRSLVRMSGGGSALLAADLEVARRLGSLSRELRLARRSRGGALRGQRTRSSLVRASAQD